MTDKPIEEEKQDDEAFQRTLRNLVNTPHKPHVPKEGREPKPAPKSAD